MNEYNNTKLAAKKKAGVNIHLYSDDHPETTTKGTGFKDAATAIRTIELVKQKPRNRQVWTINAMYYRAKHHPSQTAAMREAMSIFEEWLEAYREEKINANNCKRKIGESSDDPAAKKQKQQKQKQNRHEREQAYKVLFNSTLPAAARSGQWPVHLNHCLMRVALDGYFNCCWYDRLDQAKGALKSMSLPQIENVILIGHRMLEKGKPYVLELNERSLQYRGKQKQSVGRGKPAAGASVDANVTISSPSSDTSITQEQGSPEQCDSSALPSNTAKADSPSPLQVSRAVTARSSCRGCKAKIGKGEYRVGVQAWTSGRVVTVWQHAMCFMSDAVKLEEVTRGSSARCKCTGARFAKGDLRVVVQATPTCKQYYTVSAMKTMLVPVCALPEVCRELQVGGALSERKDLARVL